MELKKGGALALGRSKPRDRGAKKVKNQHAWDLEDTGTKKTAYQKEKGIPNSIGDSTLYVTDQEMQTGDKQERNPLIKENKGKEKGKKRSLPWNNLAGDVEQSRSDGEKRVLKPSI